ncbi:hypothetical protein [Terrabacter sp. Soil810]|uniref:channel accessory protein ArfC n=1 Tax=Terrabacter sp. Soil810 TaxID=1736418 RepID=UPI0007100B73|nr:hypothetical protein [Terrabacter sp. Soil810]KRF39484.1 hypothetical protein ASG96_14425 [Terrabacter sp. Soil810]
MKWLLLVLAFVLGAVVTWFLTVRRASRTPPVEGPVGTDADGGAAADVAPVVAPGAPVVGAVGVVGAADLAAVVGDGLLPAEADAPSEEVPGDAGPEEEATRFGGAHTAVSEEPGAAEAWDRDAQDEDALMPRTSPDVVPVVDATPNGDLAGVGEPDAVAAVDAVLPLDGDGGGDDEVDASQSQGAEITAAPAAGPTQGELAFDQPGESVPPEDKL